MILKAFFIFLAFLSSASSRAVVIGGCPRAFHSGYSKGMTIGQLKEVVKNEIAYLEHTFALLARKFSGDFTPQQIDVIAANVQSRISSLDKKIHDLLDEQMQKIAKEVYPPKFPTSVPAEKIAFYHDSMTKKSSSLIRDVSEIMRLIENFREDVSDVIQAAFDTHNLFTPEQAKLIMTYIEHKIFFYSINLALLSGEAKFESTMAESPQSEWLTDFAFFKYTPLTTTASKTEIPASKTEIQREIGHIEEQLQHIGEQFQETIQTWYQTKAGRRHNLLVSPSPLPQSPRPSLSIPTTKVERKEDNEAIYRQLSPQYSLKYGTDKPGGWGRGEEMMGNLMQEYNLTRLPSIVVEIIMFQMENTLRKDQYSLQERLDFLRKQLEEFPPDEEPKKRGRRRKSVQTET